MKRLYNILASTIVVVGAAAAVHADSVYVDMQGTQGNPGRGVWASLTNGLSFWDGSTKKTVWAGPRSMTVDGQLIKAYSVQVDARATDGWKQVFSLSDALDIQRAQVLSGLYASQNNGLFSSRKKVVAYQALIWEIVYDYDGTSQSINLHTGSLQIAGIKSNLFASMKNTAMRGGPDANLRVISGDADDGQILVVPLPSGFGLAGVGLLGLWSTTRRRKKALSAPMCA